MRIALISDAWKPQVNGIVTVLTNLRAALYRLGHEAEIFGPDRFRAWRCPGYPDAGLAFLCGPRLRPLLQGFRPDAIHLVTEGPVGFAARRYCLGEGIPFTSSFHSFFDEYLKLRVGLPRYVSRAYLRWFHRRSEQMMVSTAALAESLPGLGYPLPVVWPLGVDTELFRPRNGDGVRFPRPVFLYVGRLAVEKDVEAFLRLDLPGSRVLVGEGPQRPRLQAQYPNAHFLGCLQGETLARHLAAADVLVFPSRTDTFGLVMLEALACGVPVAALPVRGPLEVITDPRVGVLDEDLRSAALRALSLNPKACRRHALRFSWKRSAMGFLENLVPVRRGA